MPHKDPELRAASNRESQRRHRAAKTGKRKPTSKPLPELVELRLGNAKDVVSLITEQIEKVRADAEIRTVEAARCIGYLCSITLKALEQGNMEERLERLEQALTERRYAA